MTHGPDTTARKVETVFLGSPEYKRHAEILDLLRRIDERLTKIERKVERIYPGIRV